MSTAPDIPWPDHQPEDPDIALAAITEATIEERRGRVLLMKLAGATFTTIAKEQKISITTARKDYEIALASHMGETPDLIVARHRAILIDVMRANYPKMMDGDKDAAAVILKALDREAKLFGLDAPTRVLTTVSDTEFHQEAARLIGRLQEIDPTSLKELTRVGHRPPPEPEQEPLDAETVDDDTAGERAAEPADQGADPGAPPAWPPPADPADPEGLDGTEPDAPEREAGVDAGAPDGDDEGSDYLDGWSNIE